MSLAASPVTFGVEIEFNLAYLEINKDAPRHDPKEKPRLFFPITENDKERFSEEYIAENRRSFQGRSGLWNILELIRSAGYPTDKAIRTEGSPGVWKVTDDSSVRPTENSKYEWQSVEVKSPALVFSPASLELVSEVCRLIIDTYLVEVPPSAGLHVHVSAGAGPFNFRTMQALFVFLWTFESQLLSLHPPGRQQNEYCRNFRQDSTLARGWCYMHKLLPKIDDGLELLMDCEDTKSLLNFARAGGAGDSKCMAYNPINVVEFENGTCSLPTIEFRQHEGTIDSERITQWISTIVGIINRLEQISPGELLELVLSQVEREHWQAFVQVSTVNPSNQRTENDVQSIPAQSRFTVIDLLECLGLNGQAKYYRSRLFPVSSMQPVTRTNCTMDSHGSSLPPGETLVESVRRLDVVKERLRERWVDALGHN